MPANILPVLALVATVIVSTACTTTPSTTVATFVPASSPSVKTFQPAPARVETQKRVEPVLQDGSSDNGTIVCTNPGPIYPSMSYKQGEEGTVIIKLLIGRDGSPQDLRIAQSSGYPRLDRAALTAAASTRCDVFLNRKAGNPNAVWMTKPFAFRLTDPAPAQPQQ